MVCILINKDKKAEVKANRAVMLKDTIYGYCRI